MFVAQAVFPNATIEKGGKNLMLHNDSHLS